MVSSTSCTAIFRIQNALIYPRVSLNTKMDLN